MRTQTEIMAMLTALREEVERWDAEYEKAREDETGYKEYCESILRELHDKCGILTWILGEPGGEGCKKDDS